MRYRHFIWDWDGTLFDSYPAIFKAYSMALRDLGVDCEPERVKRLLKESLRQAARAIGADHGVGEEEILKAYRRFAGSEENARTIRPYPGAGETLRAVLRGGGSNYLYSHRGESGKDITREYGLLDCFADLITSEDAFPRKPAPDALLHLIAKHRLDPSECVMIGDRSIDAQAGINAGMDAVLFDPDGYCGSSPAQYTFRAMNDLRAALVDGATAETGAAGL